MKNLKFPIFIGVALLFASASFGKSITISKAVLMDKIKGGWAGKVIGCTYGGPTEFKYKDRMIPDDVEIKWPDHQIKWYYDHAPGLYDDIYMDLTFVDIFEKKGLDAPINDFANAFANAVFPVPVVPKKINEAIGFFGSCKPARERRTASATAVIASS